MTRVSAPAWIKGRVSAISDHGTIITVWVDRPSGHPHPVHCDRGEYANIVQWEGDLRGRVVRHTFEDNTLEVIS